MKNLAIFYGAKSSEHDISIITALQVMNNLNKEKYNIVPVYIHNDNSWYVLDDYKNMNNYANNILKGKKLVNGFYNKYLLVKKHLRFGLYKKIDVAINCCHGLNGEDGTLSGLLELNNIPYVGSGVVASAVGMDKVIMKDVFVANDIPCVKYVSFYKNEYDNNRKDILLNSEVKLGYPIIVKPANLGSSIGINISQNREELKKNIQIALNFDEKVILEQVVPNLREINCSVIGTLNNCETSLLEEPKNWKTFLDFNEKYIIGNKDKNKKAIDVKLADDLSVEIKMLSKKIFKIFGCSGVVRIDYLLNDKTGEVFANEINTIPGSYANYLWTHKYTFSELLDKLISNAEGEYLYKNTHSYAYKSSVLQNYKNTTKTSKINKN
ncbi:MAG: D-alanine--D-alanine ligase [Clostridia bacterium]|nr:D-alanine--D-alanine ligase [Clostridia bacterium]